MRSTHVLVALCVATGAVFAGPAGAQTASPLGAFTCHDARSQGSNVRRNVTIVDQFGTYQAEAQKLATLCAPTDVDGGDPTAPDDPAHLASYRLRTQGRFQTAQGQVVVNQYGTITLDVSRKPDRLLVPTAKSLTGPPSPLGAFVDHFTCHRVKWSRGTPRFQGEDDVTVETQFGTAVIDVRKPRSLCAPTNKNGEDPGAENGDDHLLCYQIRGGSRDRTDVFLNNQFGQQTARLSSRRELCIPSLKNPGSTTTTSSTTSTSSTSTTATVPTTTSTSTTTSTTTTTTSTSTSTTTTSSTTTTTLYGSPSRAFLAPVGGLID